MNKYSLSKFDQANSTNQIGYSNYYENHIFTPDNQIISSLKKITSTPFTSPILSLINIDHENLLISNQEGEISSWLILTD